MFAQASLARLAVRVSGETWRIVTFLTITSDNARFKGPVPGLRRLSLPASLSGRERMPKLKNLLIPVAAAMLSTSAALTDTKADDRSYLPPQDLQAQAKESGVQAAPQAEPGLRNTRAAITLRGTLAAISSLAFSLACSVSLCGLWRALQPSLRSAFRIA